jgi:DNA polymerase III delta subunit
MRFSDFRQYRAKPSDNVFVFVCEDDFLVEESRGVWTGLFEGNWQIQKLHVKEFEDIEFARLMDDALTPSLFSESRLLMVINAEKLTKGRIEDLAKLQGIASSSLKVILILGNLRPADAWTRTFTNIGIDPVKPADAIRWVMDRYGMTSDVARYVVDNVGSDLYPLHNEIEKLRTFVGSGKPITNRDVDELVLRSEQFGPYELGDAILARDYRKSVRVAGAMLADGAEPLLVLSQIVRVWRQLFIGKGLASQRSGKEVAAAVGLPPFKAGEFVAGCRKYEWRQLVLGFREILNLDRTLKSSSPDVEACFDVMLWKMTN